MTLAHFSQGGPLDEGRPDCWHVVPEGNHAMIAGVINHAMPVEREESLFVPVLGLVRAVLCVSARFTRVARWTGGILPHLS